MSLAKATKMLKKAAPTVAFDDLLDAQRGFSVYRKVYHLISKDKCEQILDSVDLSAYKGCVVLDMNPGPGILSAAIQKKIQPRRHILLEPNKAFHPILRKTILEPQLSPATTTLLTSLNGYSWKTLEKLANSKILDAKALKHEESVNTDILFVGDMTMGQTGDRFVNQLIEAVYNRNWIQQYGRVAMLACIHDTSRNRITPPDAYWRTKVSVMTELCADGRLLANTELTGRTKQYLDFWEKAAKEGGGSTANYKKVLLAERAAKEREAKRAERIAAGESVRPLAPKEPVKTQTYSPRRSGLSLREIKGVESQREGRKKRGRADEDAMVQLFHTLLEEESKDSGDEKSLEKMPLDFTICSQTIHTFSNFKTNFQTQKEPRLPLDPAADVFPNTLKAGFSLIQLVPKKLDPWFHPEDPSEVVYRFDFFVWLLSVLFTRRMNTLTDALSKVAPSGEKCLNYLEPGHSVKPDEQVNEQATEAFVQISKAMLKWPFFDRTMIYQESGDVTNDREEKYQWTSQLEEAQVEAVKMKD